MEMQLIFIIQYKRALADRYISLLLIKTTLYYPGRYFAHTSLRQRKENGV